MTEGVRRAERRLDSGGQEGQFRHLRSNLTDILHRLSGVDAALERQAIPDPRADVHHNPVGTLVLRPIFVRVRDQVAG